jgi:asparagine synthase (glutamine-hydrolysing)
MCGIAGLYRLGEREPTDAERVEDRALVERMLAAIEYRGPDDLGLESLGRATLGVRRLSILDVAGGHQPLADAARRVWAVQNGEIYNFPALRADLARRHALRTRTDTELLPHLWLERGVELVRELEGMFALAVYDTRERTLLLARDPLGVKPLYVAEHAGRLAFASELKCLLCDPGLPRELDPDAIARYLALGFIPGAATPFRAVRKLRPGARMLVRPAGAETERWWAWPAFFGNSSARRQPFEAIVEEAGRRLGASARSMLLSDRPLGVLLSGGVDSGVMTALLPAEIRRETRTFAIGFEGGGHHDERAFARTVAAHLGTRHREFTVALDVAAELPRVVHLLDEPCADPAAVPAHLVARAAASEVTVLLSGTGGDELFGGYRRHRLGELLRATRLIPAPLARMAASLAGDRDQHRATRGGERAVMARKLLEARGRSSFFGAYLSTLEPASPSRWRDALALAADPHAVERALWSELVAETGGAPSGDEAIAFATDHLYYLPDDLLLKEDRTTMGASVEGRVPFLDPSLVAWAAGLPLETRFAGNEGKRVLRALARKHLPESIASRPKHGFSVPIEDWLRGALAPLARETFAGAGSGVFRPEALRRWMDEHARRRDRSGALWAALCFELWWKSIGSATPDALVAAGRPLAIARAPAGAAGA